MQMRGAGTVLFFPGGSFCLCADVPTVLSFIFSASPSAHFPGELTGAPGFKAIQVLTVAF